MLSLALYFQPIYSNSSDREEAPTRQSIEGKWIVRAVLDLAPIVSIDEATANTLPGKVLEIADGSVSFIEYRCVSPKLKLVSIQTARFFKEYKIDTPAHLPKSVKAFTIACSGVVSYELSPLVIRRKSLLLIWRGALIELVRQGDFVPK